MKFIAAKWKKEKKKFKLTYGRTKKQQLRLLHINLYTKPRLDTTKIVCTLLVTKSNLCCLLNCSKKSALHMLELVLRVCCEGQFVGSDNFFFHIIKKSYSEVSTAQIRLQIRFVLDANQITHKGQFYCGAQQHQFSSDLHWSFSNVLLEMLSTSQDGTILLLPALNCKPNVQS